MRVTWPLRPALTPAAKAAWQAQTAACRAWRAASGVVARAPRREPWGPPMADRDPPVPEGRLAPVPGAGAPLPACPEGLVALVFVWSSRWQTEAGTVAWTGTNLEVAADVVEDWCTNDRGLPRPSCRAWVELHRVAAMPRPAGRSRERLPTGMGCLYLLELPPPGQRTAWNKQQAVDEARAAREEEG